MKLQSLNESYRKLKNFYQTFLVGFRRKARSKAPTTQLLDLPVEIIVAIFSNANCVKDVLNLSSTCRCLVNIWTLNKGIILEDVLRCQIIGYQYACQIAATYLIPPGQFYPDLVTAEAGEKRSSTSGSVEEDTDPLRRLLVHSPNTPQKFSKCNTGRDNTIDSAVSNGDARPLLAINHKRTFQSNFYTATELAKTILAVDRETKRTCAYAMENPSFFKSLEFTQRDLIKSYQVYRLCMAVPYRPELREMIEDELSQVGEANLVLLRQLAAWFDICYRMDSRSETYGCGWSFMGRHYDLTSMPEIVWDALCEMTIGGIKKFCRR